MKLLALMTVGTTVGSLLVGSVGSAGSPTRIRFDDSTFDYTANGEESLAYVALAYDGGLTVSLTSEARDALPALRVDEIPALDDEDGDEVLATVDDLEEVSFGGYGSSRSVNIRYSDLSLPDAVASFSDALRELGFSRTEAVSSANTKAYVFENGAERVRATFSRRGGDVIVRFRGM